MPKINRKELEEKAKSKFGLYKPESEKKFSKTFYELFLKNTPLKIFLNGTITTGTFAYWLITKNPLPVYIWFAYLVLINLSGYFYWKLEQKRLDSELLRLETELDKIKDEISERQKYFENLKDKIDKGEITD